MLKNVRMSGFMCFVMATVVLLSISSMAYAVQKTDAETSLAGAAIAKVNINNADVLQLATLPGVGASLAERIIKHRTEVGKFKAPADLMAVKGIGRKKYDKMLKYLVVK